MYSPITLLIPDDVTAINDNCCDFQSKEKERRLKMREEKLEQQRIHQEERVRKALERAKADPKKRVRNRHTSPSVEPSFELLARVRLLFCVACRRAAKWWTARSHHACADDRTTAKSNATERKKSWPISSKSNDPFLTPKFPIPLGSFAGSCLHRTL